MINYFGGKVGSIFKIIIYGVLLLIGLFATYIGYMYWEVSEIKQLCREAIPGTRISEMNTLISRNGGYWFKAASVKIKDEPNMWVETVCAKSTMCEASCKIYHNEIEIVEATHGARKVRNLSNEVSDIPKELTESIDRIQLNNSSSFSTNKHNKTSNPSVLTVNTSKAMFNGKQTYISFWQTNYLSGNQDSCIVEFMFGSRALTIPIEELHFKVHLLDKNGKKLGNGSFSLAEPLGGSSAESYKTAIFNGIRVKNPKEDGEYSPLCLNGVTIIFDEAKGIQSGNEVELVRNNQLRYTKQKLVNVRVK